MSEDTKRPGEAFSEIVNKAARGRKKELDNAYEIFQTMQPNAEACKGLSAGHMERMGAVDDLKTYQATYGNPVPPHEQTYLEKAFLHNSPRSEPILGVARSKCKTLPKPGG